MSSFWNGKRVFITGCTGFLGSWLTKNLVDNGAEVTGLIRDVTPKSNLRLSGTINSISAVYGSLDNYQLIERVLNEHEIDTCFHLGAQTIVTTANRSPLSTFESNIRGTWNILEAARNCKMIERVLVASSDKAYGCHDTLPYTEDAPLKGSHPYDVSKSCADLIAQAYFKTYSVPVAVTRCGNLYGGGDLNFNRIIPGTIKSVIFNEPPIIRSDGTYTRDYVYVMDAADAYLKLAENLGRKDVKGEAFNFSNENPINVIDLVDTIIDISGKSLRPTVLAQTKNEIKDQYLSAKKVSNVLGWRPYHTLKDGLSETYKWYENFFGKA